MESITENNKLIAEFMQWDKCTYQNKITNPKHPQYKKNQPIEHGFSLPLTHPIFENTYTDCPGFDWDYSKDEEQLIFYYEDLKFHASWDWLMLVVEKVESLNFAVEISESYCEIKDGSSIVIEFGGGDYTKISATYKTLVDFIKWHNQQNQVSHFEFDENGDNVVK